VAHWGISLELAERLVRASQDFASTADNILNVSIISGLRTIAEQNRLRVEKGGANVADNRLSTHLACPATGADIRISVFPTRTIKLRWLAAARLAGLRTGGGSTVDPETGIPSDWNHVDLGRRVQ